MRMTLPFDDPADAAKSMQAAKPYLCRPAFAGADDEAPNASPSVIDHAFSPAQATPCPVRKNSKVNEVFA